MNKFIFLFLLTPVAFAKPFTGNFRAVLSFSTNTDYREAHIIERKQKKITKDGFILPSEKIILGKNKLGYIVQSPVLKLAELKCPQGQYTFELTRDGKTKKESGCLGSERFGKLNSAFKGI